MASVANRSVWARRRGMERSRRVPKPKRQRVIWIAAVSVLAGAAILVGVVWTMGPTTPVPEDTRLVITVRDGNRPVGARVALMSGGEVVHFGTLDVFEGRQGGAACPISPGVVASWDGLI